MPSARALLMRPLPASSVTVSPPALQPGCRRSGEEPSTQNVVVLGEEEDGKTVVAQLSSGAVRPIRRHKHGLMECAFQLQFCEVSAISTLFTVLGGARAGGGAQGLDDGGGRPSSSAPPPPAAPGRATLQGAAAPPAGQHK